MVLLLEASFSGDRCQYETECVDDNDCNGPKGQGKCKQVDNSIFPRSQCFCAPGWQGRQCDQQSAVDKECSRFHHLLDIYQMNIYSFLYKWKINGNPFHLMRL